MYLHQPEPSWFARIVGSARTLTAILLTALLASALTVRWSDASATGGAVFTPASMAATSMPVTLEGTIVGAGDGLVGVTERGATSPVAFSVGADAQIVRGSENVPLDALRVGDQVRLTVDGLNGSVLQLHADPMASGAFLPPVSGTAAFLAALGLIAGGTLLAIRNLDRMPTLPSRVALTRLQPAATAR